MNSISTKKSVQKSNDFIQSLERGLIVIQAFSEDNPTLTVSEAAALTKLSRPAVRRILITLEELGFAISEKGTYSLTARVLSLGYSYLSSQNMWNLALPFMKEFVNEAGESCSISVLDDTEIVYVARVQANRIMRINLNIGTRLPASVTSMGHILLAHLEDDDLKKRISRLHYEEFTPQTITNPNELLSELHRVKHRGWAGVDQQLEEGLRSIAVPLYRNSKVIASINCSAHAGRVSNKDLHEHFLPLLQKTADEISKAITTSLKID